ncbi:redox-sensitive transcriptional activator SoxR [Haloglycomyces albus]|uniref:redox-sensitive transcriptional activator SoxR n=1 Tax=Haloglycomyces albus TaxID=526067 RepID=UPI00046D73FD|nr:redox-sensitive transcriptional activator SoxR [Haloglycomyces albus]
MTLGELTIGEFARRSGTSAPTLRFYEQKGLIHSHRTPGNQRRYHRRELRRVAFIRASQAVGMSLREIKDALDRLPHHRTPTPADWNRISIDWHQRLEDKIATLERIRDRLDECVGCGCLSAKNCGLINPDDKAAVENDRCNELEPHSQGH